MNKYLPAAWLFLIPISAIATTAVFLSLYGKTPDLRLLAAFTGFIGSVPFYGALAALYAILNRVTSRRLVFALGWAHLAFSFVGFLGGAWFRHMNQQSLAAGERLDLETMMFWSWSLGVFSALSTLAFFAAMLAAFQDTRKRINLQAFD